ncbi:hypothetical protein [Nocardioides litoris]|uniref:hypothetical protein n=1 Tax=Nocardioides litoris TaxID=1926648 RepID=UPI00111ED3A7|nr:hypothetical protein [Nocardioides litoris]
MSTRRPVPPVLVLGTVLVVLGGALHLAGSVPLAVGLTLLGGLLVVLVAAAVRPVARPERSRPGSPRDVRARS